MMGAKLTFMGAYDTRSNSNLEYVLSRQKQQQKG